MGLVDNVLTFQQEWETKVQEMLDEKQKWRDICDVQFTNTQTIHKPYLTDATVQTHSRGTPYTPQAITLTDDSVAVTTSRILSQFIDYADLAQLSFYDTMQIAERQGIRLADAIETTVFAAHASFTDFDNASIGGSAGNITVSDTNIDNIIQAIKREIRQANGEQLMDRNGLFLVWRPEDFELLERFMMANGFVTADRALQNGGGNTQNGVNYMGFTHYSSNKLASGHVAAGVKKAISLYFLTSTYGRVYTTPNQARTSGLEINSRVDFAVKVWNNFAAVLFDVLVA